MAAGDLATLRRHQWQDAVCDRRGVIAAFLVRQIRGRRIAPNAIFSFTATKERRMARSIGRTQISGYVLEKLDPRKGKNETYYTLIVGDIGWQHRFAVTPEVYNAIPHGEARKLTFLGSAESVRATRAGGQYPDDFIGTTLDRVEEWKAPKAPEVAAPKA